VSVNATIKLKGENWTTFRAACVRRGVTASAILDQLVRQLEEWDRAAQLLSRRQFRCAASWTRR
jgi:hypothetical protein